MTHDTKQISDVYTPDVYDQTFTVTSTSRQYEQEAAFSYVDNVGMTTLTQLKTGPRARTDTTVMVAVVSLTVCLVVKETAACP